MDEVRAELKRRHETYEKRKRERRRRLLYTAPALALALVITTVLLPWGDWFSPVSLPGSPYPSDPTDPRDPPKSTAPSEPQEPLTPDMPTSPDAPLHGNASYHDGVDSFDALVEAADVILLGTVVSTVQPSSVTETARVRVEKIYALGAGIGVADEIELYQMQQSHTVSRGKTYLLFLKQQADLPGAFYSIGGGQGTIDYTNGRVSVTSHVIDTDEVTAWLAQANPIE